MEDITAEYDLQELTAPVELKFRPRVTLAARTDLGRVRENNEDKFDFYMPEDERSLATRGLMFLLCDGMGGHAAGQIASEMACKKFIAEYLHYPSSDPEAAARTAVALANRFVLEVARTIPSRRGMGTTLSALLLIQDRAMVVQVGDSRIYRLRGEALERLTEDHTWVEEVVKAGIMVREDAEIHQNRNMLMRAIGVDEADSSRPDIFWYDLQPGDVFLLCSDGLTNHASDEQIGEYLKSDPSDAAWKLVDAALAGGGSDNCTVLIVRVDRLESLG